MSTIFSLMEAYHRVVKSADQTYEAVSGAAFATLKQRYKEYANAFMNHLRENLVDGQDLHAKDWNTVSIALRNHQSTLQSKYDFMCDLVEKLMHDHQSEMLRASQQRMQTLNQWHKATLDAHGIPDGVRNGQRINTMTTTRNTIDPAINPRVNAMEVIGSSNAVHFSHQGTFCDNNAVSDGSRSPSISSEISDDDQIQNGNTTNGPLGHSVLTPGLGVAVTVPPNAAPPGPPAVRNHGDLLFAVPPPPPPRRKETKDVKKDNDRKRCIGDLVNGDHDHSPRASKRRRVSVERSPRHREESERSYHRGHDDRDRDHRDRKKRDRSHRTDDGHKSSSHRTRGRDRSRGRDPSRDRDRDRSHDHREHSNRDRDRLRSKNDSHRRSRREREDDRGRESREYEDPGQSMREYEEHYDFEQHRDEMKLMARRCRGFNLSQFDRVYVGHFKRSIRHLYGGKLKSLVKYFGEYFVIQQDRPLNQCNIKSLIFKDAHSSSTSDHHHRDQHHDDIDANHHHKRSRSRSRSRERERSRRVRSRTPLLTKEKGLCSISGAWSAEGDEDVQMVLWEDFVSHKVIGFMSYKGRSECTVHGKILTVHHRNDRIRYDLVKVYHDDESRSHYTGTMSRDWKRVELVKETKGGTAKIQRFTITHKENIPTKMYHALMQLKHVHWDKP